MADYNYAQFEKEILQHLQAGEHERAYSFLTAHYPEQFLAELVSTYNSKKDNTSAIEVLEQLLKVKPDDPLLLQHLGVAYYNDDKPKEGLSYLHEALKKNSSNYAVSDFIWNTELNCKEPNYQKLNEIFLWLANQYPDDYNYWIRLGYINSVIKNYDDSIKYYLKTEPLCAPNVTLQANLANAYYNNKNYANAIKHYKKALEIDPCYKTALQFLCEAAQKSNTISETIEYFKEVTKKDSNNKEAQKYLAKAFYYNKKYECAIARIKNLIKEDVNDKEAYDILWDALLDSKQYFDRGVVIFKEAATKYPNHADHWFRLAYSYWALCDYGASIGNYKKYLELDPDNASALQNIGTSYENNKQPNEAIENYKKALAINPSSSVVFNNLLNICYEEKQLHEFVETAKKLFVKKTKLPVLNDIYAYNDVLNNQEDTIEFIGSYFNKNLKDLEAFKLLSFAHTVLKKHSTFLNRWDKLHDKNNNAEYHFITGNVYLDKLDYINALARFNKALELDKDYYEALHNKAYIAERQGNFNSAKEMYLQVTEGYKQRISEEEKLPLEQQNKKAIGDYYFEIGMVLFRYEKASDLNKAKDAFEKARSYNPDSTILLLNLANYYAEEKLLIAEKKSLEKDDPVSLSAEYNAAHMNLMECFFKGTQILERSREKYPYRFNLWELGEFYIVAEQYDKAKQVFNECVQLAPSFSSGYIGAGVACMKMGEYIKAIDFFKKALVFDPLDFNTQSNLAEAYLKSERYGEAEKQYRQILSYCPTYIDALLGLAEYFKIMGDKATEENNASDAEDWYQKAKKNYQQLLKINIKDEVASRRFKLADLNSIHYSLGYIKVKLHELGSGSFKKQLWNMNTFNFSLLQSAKKDFGKIQPGEDNYYKAQNAIRKINKEQSLKNSITKKWAPAVIICASIIVLLLTQYGFFVGMNDSKKDSYKLNISRLQNLVQKDSVTLASIKNIKEIAGEKFETKEEVFYKLSTVADLPHQAIEESLIKFPGLETRQKISETSYGLLTFSSLIFIIIGFFLSQISKLKVGSIELEKSVIDTSSTSTALGINK